MSKLNEEEGGLDLTSMTDCVFLLIIFFMVCTVFKDPQRLKVDLPSAEMATNAEEKILNIVVTDNGKFEINGRPTSLDNLIDDMMIVKSGLGEAHTVILKADKKVKYSKIYEVMKSLQFCGISKVVIATTKAYPGGKKR